MTITQNALVALGLSFVPVFIISFKNRHMKTVAAKIIDDAAKAGRFTKAVAYKKRHRYVRPEDYGKSGFVAYKVWYKYTVDGKEYKTVRGYGINASVKDEITVFWKEGRPGKVYSNDFDKLGVKYTAMMLLPYIMFLIIFGVLQIASSWQDIIAKAIQMG